MKGKSAMRHALPATLTAVLLLLAGCADPTAPPPTLDTSPKSVGVQTVQHEFEYRVDPRSGEAPADERLRLADFLGGLGDLAAAHVTLSGASAEPLRRAARQIVRLGVPPGNVRVAADAAPSPAQHGLQPVHLLAERAQALLPDCPDLSHLNLSGNLNANSSNFGCATASNFAVMLADPRDLLGRRTDGGTAAEPAAAAVRTYLENKVPALPERDQKLVIVR